MVDTACAKLTALRHSRYTPIVAAMCLAVIQWRKARHKPRPTGQDIMGLFLDLPELNGKRLEPLRELAPRLRRIAVLWDPSLGPAR